MGEAETHARARGRPRRRCPAWRGLLAKERARILRDWADLMLEQTEPLARLLTIEQGKPLAESSAEIEYAASFLEWFGEEAKRVYGDTIPTYMQDRRIVVTKEPIGVTAGITPWNFPAAMVTRKAAPALAAGCTMVLKPAEQTPLIGARRRAARPRGGPARRACSGSSPAAREDAPAIGRVLTSSPVVRKLGFTGSTEVGKLLMAQCARTGEEGLARARRQRAVHRLRRRRPRRGGRGRARSASSATRARRASRPTGSSSRRRSTTRSSQRLADGGVGASGRLRARARRRRSGR